MSLDFSLTEQTIDGDTEVFEINITHNLTGMADALGIYEMLWKPEKNGYLSASSMIPKLKDAIIELASNREKYSKFNPSNGWGSYDNFLVSLCEILENLKRYPSSKPSSWI